MYVSVYQARTSLESTGNEPKPLSKKALRVRSALIPYVQFTSLLTDSDHPLLNYLGVRADDAVALNSVSGAVAVVQRTGRRDDFFTFFRRIVIFHVSLRLK